MRKFSKSVRVILAASVALSWYSFVKADDGGCGVEEVQVIVQPETTSYQIIPGAYEWVDGEVGGSSLEYRVVPPVFETVDDSYEVAAANKINIGWGKTKHLPPVIKPYEKKNISHEAYPVAKFVANLVRDGRTRIQTKRPTFEAMTIPAQTRTLTRKKPCQLVSSAKTSGE